MTDKDNRIRIEVCAESIESALTAQDAGAYRIEFCDNMAEGGTTPSYGQIQEARRVLDIKLYPIIRPRGGDFIYSDIEFEVMKRDVCMCGEAGCDGVVIGMLRPDSTVDTERCAVLVAIAGEYGMGVTFHRAFDVAADLGQALEDVIGLGCERILTSGGRMTAHEGMSEIRRLVKQADGRITIMPGSGVQPATIREILLQTGCREIHGTFRKRFGSPAGYKPDWADYEVWHTDGHRVRMAVQVADEIQKLL